MTGLIHIPYWWHASLFEIMWLTGGLVAAVLTAANVVDSLKDRPVLAELRDDPAMHDSHWQMISLAAKGREGSQITRLIISVLITGTGLVGVLQPNPLKGATTWTGFAVTFALIAIAYLTASRSLLDYRLRNQMFELAQGRSSVIAAKLRIHAARKPAGKSPHNK